MSAICYYSNFCEPSKKLLQLFAKTKLKQEIHFICIDKRFRNAKGQTILQMEQHQVLLPDAIRKVPALFLIDSQNVLYEDDIYNFLTPKENTINTLATSGNGEPECYSLNQMSCMSDSYSFLDQDSTELSTKGSGGVRQLHNYVTLDQNFSIQTPDEDYIPDKIGNNGSKTVEQLKAEREKSIMAPIQRI
jgi:hypothetical protein